MLKDKIKLLVLDLDYTLVNWWDKISRENKKKILEVQKQGIKVIIVTGRSLKGSLPIAQKLEIAKYGGSIIFLNGAGIYESNHNQFFLNQPFQWEVICPAEKIGKKSKNTKIFIDEKGQYFAFKRNFITFLFSLLLRTKIKKVNFATLVTKKIISAFIAGKNKNVKKEIVELQLKEKGINAFAFKTYPYSLYELSNTSKAEGLQKWLAQNKFSSDQVLAIVDGDNDYSLLKMIKYGVAVQNAKPQIKKIAYDQTAHWKKNGVAKTIQKHLLN